MRCRLALLAFCSVAAAAAQTPPDGAFLTVILQGQRVVPPILNAMEREVEGALDPAGVRLSWRWQDLPDGEVTGQVAIIRMRGKCTAALPAHTAPLAAEEPLGQTHVANGKVLPFAELLCDAVRTLVERDLRGRRASEREQLLGRAFGRVLAHELYHILSRTPEHGEHGLARPEQSSAELLAPGGAFAESEQRRIAASVGADAGR